MTLPVHDYPDWQRSLNTADLFVLDDSIAVPAGTSVDSATQDMRPYQSFQIVVDAQLSEAATAYGYVYIDCRWFNDAAQTQEVFRQGYIVLPGNLGAANFRVDEFLTFIEDRCHGPFMDIQIRNEGPDDIAVTYAILGNTRPVSGPLVRQETDGDPTQGAFDGSMLLNLDDLMGAGATQTYAMRIAPGWVWLRLEAVTQNHTFTLVTPNGLTLDSFAVVAGAETVTTMLFPTESVRLAVTNTGAGDGTHRVRVVHERRSW